jgi:hypothetical protein
VTHILPCWPAGKHEEGLLVTKWAAFNPEHPGTYVTDEREWGYGLEENEAVRVWMIMRWVPLIPVRVRVRERACMSRARARAC